VKDAIEWEVDTERDASEFYAGYYGGLLEKAWDEVASLLADVQSCRVFSSNSPTYANFDAALRNQLQ